MDLIYTNAQRIEMGVLSAYSLDLSFGADANENNFELTLGKSEPALEDGAIIYIEGTEYGGIVGGMKSNTEEETRVSIGRTWHGVLNSKVIQPEAGQSHLVANGDANEVLDDIIHRLGLSALFSASSSASGVNIKGYKFHRYVKGYDGLRAMLDANGAKLKMRWISAGVELYAEPVIDFTDYPVDGDQAVLSVERYSDKVNHLICLGAGELENREVLHLYVDQFGRIGDTQFYTGLEEVADVYDYANASSADELREEGIKKLEELRNIDSIDVTAHEGSGLEYDVGDIIGGTDTASGNTAKAAVIQKIVKINNGAVSIDYKTSR